MLMPEDVEVSWPKFIQSDSQEKDSNEWEIDKNEGARYRFILSNKRKRNRIILLKIQKITQLTIVIKKITVKW